VYGARHEVVMRSKAWDVDGPFTRRHIFTTPNMLLVCRRLS
jgi:hypothetical protein